MNKLQTTVYITATKVDIENNKIIAVEGEFYFQGKRYKIKDKQIVAEHKEKIPF